MKRTVILLVALLLVLSAAWVAPAAQAEAPKPWRIVFVNALVGHPVYNDQDRGVLDAVKDFGPEKVDVQIIGASDTNGLAEKTIEFIDQAIAMKPDAIVCEPWDPSMFAAIDRAVAAGIPVMCLFFIATAIGAYFLYSKTLLGFRMKAVGGSAKAARASGINSNVVKTAAFAIVGFLSGIIPQTVADLGKQNMEAGAELAASILASGPSGISKLNTAITKLEKAADKLGTTTVAGLPQYGDGGRVGGTGGRRADDQIIAASTGEIVMGNDAVDMWGEDRLLAMNSGALTPAMLSRHYVAAPRGQAQTPAFPDHLTLTAGSLTGQMRLVGDGIFELVDARLEAYAGMGAARTRGA